MLSLPNRKWTHFSFTSMNKNTISTPACIFRCIMIIQQLIIIPIGPFTCEKPVRSQRESTNVEWLVKCWCEGPLFHVSRHADALPHQPSLGDKDPAGAAVQCRPFTEAVQGNDGRPRENIPSRGYPGTLQGTSTDFKLTRDPVAGVLELSCVLISRLKSTWN